MEIDDLLKRSLAIEILKSLLDGQKSVMEVYKKIPGSGSIATLEQRLKDLLEAGLVTDERISSFPQKRIITLTSEGKRIAQVLWFLEESYDPKRLSPRKKWLLRVIGAVGGEVRDATRIEKLIFLLKEECGAPVESNFYPFIAQKFGPYSKEIMDDTRSLEGARLIEIDEKSLATEDFSDTDIIQHVYRLTERGKEVAADLLKELPPHVIRAMKKKLDGYNSVPLSDLLRYVHEAYPEYYLGNKSKEKKWTKPPSNQP